MDNEGLITRLRKRAEIRRSIPRGEPDCISDILEEAADMIKYLRADNERINKHNKELESILSSNHNWIRGGS
jgi:dsDNA-specific endonuclease/ATPase MutS2